MFTLAFADGEKPRTHKLKDGETIIGRAPTCELVISTPLISRQHARIFVKDGRVLVRDNGSLHGTTYKGELLTSEKQIHPGETFAIANVVVTLECDAEEPEVLSEKHQMFDDSGTIMRPVYSLGAAGPVAAPPPAPASILETPYSAAPSPAATTRAGTTRESAVRRPPAPVVGAERRSGTDRRKMDLGRGAGNRRSGRDRRGGRMLRLLTEISKTLVTVQPLEQVFAKVVDLVFDVLPAERAFLLLRDSADQPLTPRVLRNRDGSAPANATISRTVVNKVMRERVAMLAKDALYDRRLDASASIQAMNIRSFLCAPLWNREEVIGVLYCDNPRSKQFTAEDLEIFAALCNYAAVAIEQARLSSLLVDEMKRRERLQRYHSPGVVSKILHGSGADDAFVTQERDVSVMFLDIVGFTKMSQHASPQQVGDMLNNFFGRMGDILFEYDGTLDKFIGDAILAMFGAPFDQPDHAVRAVGAALAMRKELGVINVERQAHGQAPINIRIAINSGRALTGDIGSPKRREFTVLGDVVNTASRIESSVAKPGQVVISDDTRKLVGDHFRLESLGKVTLRGRDTELETFAVLD